MKRRQRTTWRVLLAEDDDDHALLIGMALERASPVPVEIIRARTGDEAVVAIQDRRPDLILLDLHMPGRSGHEVLEVVKQDQEHRRIPVAVLTSSDRDEDMSRSYGLGGNHFITKPESPQELEHKLRSLLQNLDELSSIRRGSGQVAAAAVSALNPDTLATRRFAAWGGLLVVVLFLLVFAWMSGVLGG
jgi:CheY-like chemotaxis protein